MLSREGTGRERSPASRIRPEAEDIHVVESGERDGGREAKSWLDLALSLLSLGEEEEAIAAYERAYTLDPTRASRSLFRPMLRLVTAAQQGAIESVDRPSPVGLVEPVAPTVARSTHGAREIPARNPLRVNRLRGGRGLVVRRNDCGIRPGSHRFALTGVLFVEGVDSRNQPLFAISAQERSASTIAGDLFELSLLRANWSATGPK